MKGLTHLLPTNLYAVEIPEEANEFKFHNYNVSGLFVEQTDSKELNAWKCQLEKLNKYQILGTVTKDSISFDTEDLVEKHPNIGYRDYNISIFKHAENWTKNWIMYSANESFYSLLANYGIYFTNPLGEMPDVEQPHNSRYIAWEQAENKLVKKVLILKETLKTTVNEHPPRNIPMTKIKKLEVVVKEWERKSEDLLKESVFAREHNFFMEAQVLNQKRELVDEMCRSIRLKVIEELIPV